MFRYASELDPTDDKKVRMDFAVRHNNFILIQKAKGGYLEGVIQLPQRDGDKKINQKILLSTMSSESEGGSEREQFHPNMIHLLRKQEDGKDRIPAKEPVPNIDHWKLELILKTEDDFLNLYVINKTSKKDENRNIEPTDLLFPVGPDKVIKMGKDKRKLHLTILFPKTKARGGKGEEVSLDKIVKERITGDQAIAETEKRFEGKNSKNLKKVQLKCEVFDLTTDIFIDSAISEVIRDNKEYGPPELKEVRPKVSCSQGGRDILVVTEKPVTKGTVVPVFQLFDHLGNRSEVEEQWLAQPEVLEDDGRIFRFLSPKQENYEKWSHLNLNLVLRRKLDDYISESISRFNFEYRPHDRFQLISETSSGCLDCSFNFLDGDQNGHSRADRTETLLNDSPAAVIDSVLVSPALAEILTEDLERMHGNGGTTTKIVVPPPDKDYESFIVNPSDVLAPRSEIELKRAALSQSSEPGLKKRKMNKNNRVLATADGPMYRATNEITRPRTLATETLLKVTGRIVDTLEDNLSPVQNRSAVRSFLKISLFVLIFWLMKMFLGLSVWIELVLFLCIIVHDGPIIYQDLRGFRKWIIVIVFVFLGNTLTYNTFQALVPILFAGFFLFAVFRGFLFFFIQMMR